MQIHNLIQGSAEWHQFRLTHFGASEAAAMLGLSPKVKRNELLHMKHTGTAKEFSDWVQANILDHGHEVEAMARPHGEAHIGDDLYPVTCSAALLPESCDFQLSASCDGLTMCETIGWEHKQWNEELAASVRAGVLPDEYQPQVQQELMVTGADRWIFTVSDGTPGRMVHIEVLPDQAWFNRILAGWQQFAKDLAEYQPRQLIEKPEAEAILALPALVVQIRGEVANSNLPAFKAAAERFIANIRTDLQTDEDFANAEATVKFCDAAEKDLEHAKAAAIAQTASIDDLMRTVDHIKEQLRTKRLMLTKLVDKRKVEIKEAILAEAKLAYAEHVAALEAEIKPLRLAQVAPDFVGAMKNKRTLASLHDAVDTLLASAKIATAAMAADYRAKQTWCKENAAGYGFLFMDMQQLIGKPVDDFRLVVNTRITEHKKAEADKAEALRVQVIQEEQDRIAKEKTAAEQASAARVASAAITQAAAPQDGPNSYAASSPAHVGAPVFQSMDMASGPGQTVERTGTRLPATSRSEPSGPPTLRLGQICERLGFTVTADFLRALGFEPASRERSAVLYHEVDFPRICAALVDHIANVSELQPA